jgi:hypothetical protein
MAKKKQPVKEKPLKIKGSLNDVLKASFKQPVQIKSKAK